MVRTIPLIVHVGFIIACFFGQGISFSTNPQVNLKQIGNVVAHWLPRPVEQPTSRPAAAYRKNPRRYARRSLCAKVASDGDSGKQPRKPNPFRRLLLLRTTLPRLRQQLVQRYVAWYRRLSKRMKRIFALQVACLMILVASLTRSFVTQGSLTAPPPPVEVSYSSFLQLVERQKDNSAPIMDRVRIGSDRIHYRLQRPPADTESANDDSLLLELPSLTAKGKQRLLQHSQRQQYLSAYTRKVVAPPELLERLRTNEVSFSAAPPPPPSPTLLAIRATMTGLYVFVLYRVYRNISTVASNNKNEVMGKLANAQSDVSFDDIQGIDDAKTEVMELVDTLRNPEKYAIMGARAPTGLLLVGPPGTGKTMLARVTAATARVPLIYCSGSDFVEMFVGRGAARVRKLFERAEKAAPCILFCDELDALGKSRDMGGGMFQRSNDEAEQTLNQLLACMDGLDSSRQVCVMAATNRKEVLDSALIRPGRFDRIVTLKLPDTEGREKILRVHASKLPGFTESRGVSTDRPNALGKEGCVDLSAVAAVTDGFSGAELEFLVNEAAIRAVRRVSAAIQANRVVVHGHVEARDFEASIRNFYESRKPRGGGVNDMLRGVWKQ